ncbi:hypothetical protein QT972_00335 [Microcoleus sp. herbarium7]|uniref:hypothetical protein n=1 Tax=Microcoleus sp. herbarium7 TaxID=3055435 RepID=UPI002FD4C05F
MQYEQRRDLTINVNNPPGNLETSGIPLGISPQQITKQPSLVKAVSVISGIGIVAGLGVGIPIGASINSVQVNQAAIKIEQAEKAVFSAQKNEQRLGWEKSEYCKEK